MKELDSAYLYQLAKFANAEINLSFGIVLTEQKPDGTVVTEVDRKINEMVIDLVRRDFPQVSIVGEEASHLVDGSEYTVFVDPVDGTLPFTIGMPIASFCISVVHNGRPVYAVISDPFQNRIWYCTEGYGAYLNAKTQLKVSMQSTLKGAKIGYVCWPNAPFEMHNVVGVLQEKGALCMNPMTIAYLGALVASGKLDATVFPATHVWETSAMDLFAEEAGGRATDLFGKPLFYDGPGAKVQGHVISNGLIHDEITAIVRACQS
jgi:fructose-1,6-bisphosphatase/inositol monophosphatase family enzyme